MHNISFEEVWARIVAHAGETFYMKRDHEEFTYIVKGNGFYPSRTSYRISKKDFKTAYGMMPIKGPGPISNIVRGPSYVWAVLNNPRIL